jgi:hypothetical protein
VEVGEGAAGKADGGEAMHVVFQAHPVFPACAWS